MRQFVIPQFIDVETKIIGFITVRQFVILLIGGFFLLITYKLCDFTLFLVVGIITILLTGILAFYKVNGRPVHYFLINFFETIRKPKLKVWNKDLSGTVVNKPLEIKEDNQAMKYQKKEFSRSKLAELSLLVDTGGTYALSQKKKYE